jgi:hypothetical protein
MSVTDAYAAAIAAAIAIGRGLDPTIPTDPPDEPEDCRGSHRDTGRGVCADCGEFLGRGDK